MLRRGSRWLGVVLTSALALTPSRAFAQELSADMQVTGGALAAPASGTLHLSNRNLRIEIAVGGMDVAVLADTSSETIYVLMPAERMYMPVSAAMAPVSTPPITGMDWANPCGSEGVTNCESLGSESVNGYDAAGWRYDANGTTWTAWVSSDFQIPLRVISGDGTTTDFSNIVEGPQDPALFEVPADYQQMPGFGGGAGFPG